MDPAPAPAAMPRRCPRPTPFRPGLGLALALLAAPVLAARPLPEWRLDPVHSRVLFEVEHAGFSQALATLSAPEGRLRYAPGRWEGAEVEVRLPLSRLDFGDAGWNEAMLGRRWFDAGRHPEILFRSTRVEPIDAERARVPERIEQGWTGSKLTQPLRGPGQVIGLLLTGGLQLACQRLVGSLSTACRQGLGGVQRLGAHFAHVVDPHQGTSQLSILLLQVVSR